MIGVVALPPVPYRPGQTPRPPEGLFAAEIAALESLGNPADPADLARSAAFVGGIAAFRAGYFWEAHELWEPVWMRLPPQSPERHLMQGLIQRANAELKRAMGQPGAAARIDARARAALAEAFLRGPGPVMGFTPAGAWLVAV